MSKHFNCFKTNSIVGFFENSHLNQMIGYLSKYISAGKDLSKDLALLEKFANVDEIISTIESAIKLFELIMKYDDSIRLYVILK